MLILCLVETGTSLKLALGPEAISARIPLSGDRGLVMQVVKLNSDETAHRMIMPLQVAWHLKDHVTAPLPQPRVVSDDNGPLHEQWLNYHGFSKGRETRKAVDVNRNRVSAWPVRAIKAVVGALLLVLVTRRRG